MDVQPGHCWRCEKNLLEHTVPCRPCPRCKMAVYCSSQCQDRDNIRHSAVECEMFREKKCSACGKLGKTLACSACDSAWYCNTDCQRRGRPTHKKACQEILSSIKQLSSKLYRVKIDVFGDFPEYFGNTMAKDFLQLDNNEWSKESVGEEQLNTDYHVLSAGCGDLRNTVLTVASLPTEYQGKLHVTLSDLDPFVMARNVLFLFMLVRFADTDYIVSSLTTIWYSLHISKREYDLIKTSLDELIQMSAQQLHDATKGLVSVLDEDFRYLRKVWKGWQSLECQRDKKPSINLRQQRQERFENCNEDIKEECSRYVMCLNANDGKQIREWFEHGLFLPCEAKQSKIPYDNPTLTAPKVSKDTALFGSPLFLLEPQTMLTQAFGLPNEDYMFVYRYLISPKRMPFTVWDCLRVKKHSPGSHSSLMVMYHEYVTNHLQKVQSFILQGRLLIHVSLANFVDFPKHHQTLNMPHYDRIFTSNLADYVGFDKLLQKFKPLLNTSNSYSVIVTETMGFNGNVTAAIPWNLPEPRCQKLIGDYLHDWQTTEVALHNIFDYYNNTPHFLQYLRADIMAGGPGTPALKDVPSFESVKKCQGMRMRDFRKELNKLVPFRYRVNERDFTLMNNLGDRAVEWLLPETEK